MIELIKIEFKIRPPEGATNKEILDWIRFELGDLGEIETKNPCMAHDLECLGGSLTVKRNGCLL